MHGEVEMSTYCWQSMRRIRVNLQIIVTTKHYLWRTGSFNCTIILCRTNWLNSPAAWKGFLDLSILSQKPCYVANVRCHPYFHVLDKSMKTITRFNIGFEYILDIRPRKVNKNLSFLLNYLFCSSIIHIWIFEFLYNITFLVSSKIPRQIGLSHISLWVYGVCMKRKKYMNIYFSGITLVGKVKIVFLI